MQIQIKSIQGISYKPILWVTNFAQNYAREQADNPESYDVVKELVSFLKVFESFVGTNLTLAIQLFSTLTELVLDNPENQVHSRLS